MTSIYQNLGGQKKRWTKPQINELNVGETATTTFSSGTVDGTTSEPNPS